MYTRTNTRENTPKKLSFCTFVNTAYRRIGHEVLTVATATSMIVLALQIDSAIELIIDVDSLADRSVSLIVTTIGVVSLSAIANYIGEIARIFQKQKKVFARKSKSLNSPNSSTMTLT